MALMKCLTGAKKLRATRLCLFHSKVICHFMLFIPFTPQSTINKLIGFFGM